ERQPIFARLRKDQREAVGREGLKFVGIEVEGAPLAGGDVGARQGRLRDRRPQQRAEQMRGAFPEPAFRQVADDNSALVHQSAQGDVLFGCASMLRSLGSMSALPILFWIGEIASARK